MYTITPTCWGVTGGRGWALTTVPFRNKEETLHPNHATLRSGAALCKTSRESVCPSVLLSFYTHIFLLITHLPQIFKDRWHDFIFLLNAQLKKILNKDIFFLIFLWTFYLILKYAKTTLFSKFYNLIFSRFFSPFINNFFILNMQRWHFLYIFTI